MPFHKIRFKAVFLSDIHLGTRDSKVHEVNELLRRVECEKLVLNGDIIDGWAMSRNVYWNKEHTRFLRLVLKKAEKQGTDVIYLRGNHDDFLTGLLPLRFDKIQIANEHLHETNNRRYLVVHGDGFDRVTTDHRWMALLGSVGYQGLLGLNRFYNDWRRLRGKEHFSLSKAIKARVKSAVSFVSRYEDQLLAYAKDRECDGIICGHIHTAADKQVENVHYLNSGDWVESLTAVVETLDGEMKVLTYEEFKELIAAQKAKTLKARAMRPAANGKPKLAISA